MVIIPSLLQLDTVPSCSKCVSIVFKGFSSFLLYPTSFLLLEQAVQVNFDHVILNKKSFKIVKRFVLGWAFVEYTHSNHHLIIGMSVAKGLSGSSSSVLFKKEEEERILRSGAREDVTLVLLFCFLLTTWNHILVTRKNWIC